MKKTELRKILEGLEWRTSKISFIRHEYVAREQHEREQSNQIPLLDYLAVEIDEHSVPCTYGKSPRVWNVTYLGKHKYWVVWYQLDNGEYEFRSINRWIKDGKETLI